MRKLVFALVVLGAMAATSCYSPKLVGGFDCNSVAPLCPSGFECSGADHKCYAAGQLPVDGGIMTIDGSTPGDGSTPIDAGPALRPPIQVADGRNVALARITGGARLAYEDSLTARTDSPAAIRYVDIDNAGHVSSQMPLEGNQTHLRNGLIGAGDQSSYFAWIDTDLTSPGKQTLTVVSNNSPPAALPSIAVASTARIPYAVAASGNAGFVFYSDPNTSALMVARITTASLTPIPVVTAPVGHTIDEITALTSDDNASLIVAWHELTTSVAGLPADEYVRITRITTAGLAQVWPSTFQIAHDQFTTAPHYRRLRLAASTRANMIGLTYELDSQASVNQITYTSGSLQPASALLDNLGFPTPALLPQSSNGAATLLFYLSGIARTAGDRGPMVRRRVAPSAEVLSPVGAMVTNVIGFADGQDNVYSVGQDGGDLGGNIVAWGRPGPGWPDTGLILSSNAGQARAILTAIARRGGGLHVAWVENGANEGQIFVQTLLPNATSP